MPTHSISTVVPLLSLLLVCFTNSWGTDLSWAEVELELNEIQYTEADEVERQRAVLSGMVGAIPGRSVAGGTFPVAPFVLSLLRSFRYA
jgi:hypothetical protein